MGLVRRPSEGASLRARARSSRGFTLVEMMVAMMAGILVAMSAFLIARNASSFFQHEARITGAQFAGMIGLTRLKTDLRRAGMMSSPNVQRDPSLCGSTATWPAGMAELAGIYIQNNGSALRHPADHKLSGVNKLTPDALILGAVQSTTEHFAVQAMQNGGGGGYDIFIQQDGAWWRTSLASQAGGSVLGEIFVVGRMLRIVDEEGRQGYGVITGLDDAARRVSVAANPALPIREIQLTCGCVKPCTGALVNPVARVLYDLRSLATHPDYKALFTAGQHTQAAKHKGELPIDRTELVRVELDATGTEIPGSTELVAEYAVDLKFGVTVQTPGGPPNNLPTVQRYAIGAGQVYNQANTDAAGGRPERITDVQVRLSTRSPRRDRDVGIPAASDGGVFRYNLGVQRGFARVRTLVADIHLLNQAAVPWLP